MPGRGSAARFSVPRLKWKHLSFQSCEGLLRNRISYLDICKGLGIVLVILGHIFYSNPLKPWIFSFHMPLFFFLAGCSHACGTEERLGRLIFKRFKSLMVPYFFFAVITYAYWLLWERHFVTDYTYGNMFAPIIGIPYGIGTGPWLGFNGVLWFLPCLFLTDVYLALLLSTSRRWLLPVGLTACSILGYALAPKTLWLPWSAGIALTSVVFAGVGYSFQRSGIGGRLSAFWRAVLIVAAASINIWAARINSPVAMNAGSYGNFFLFYLAAFSGIALVYFVSMAIGTNKWLSLIGANTLVVFCIHGEVYRIFIKVLAGIVGISTNQLRDSTLYALAVTLLTLCVSIPISLLITARAPFIVGRKARPRGDREMDLIRVRHAE